MVLVVKNTPASAGDVRDAGSIPEMWKIPWRRAWQPFQDSCLENPMDRGAWRPTAHGVTKSQTWLSDLACTHAHHFIPYLLYLLVVIIQDLTTCLLANYQYFFFYSVSSIILFSRPRSKPGTWWTVNEYWMSEAFACAPEGTCAYLYYSNSHTVLIGLLSLSDFSTKPLEGSWFFFCLYLFNAWHRINTCILNE